MARDIISEFVFIAESKHVACQIVVIYFSWREAETHHTLVPGFVDSREKPGTTEITDPRTQYLVLNEEPSLCLGSRGKGVILTVDEVAGRYACAPSEKRGMKNHFRFESFHEMKV